MTGGARLKRGGKFLRFKICLDKACELLKKKKSGAGQERGAGAPLKKEFIEGEKYGRFIDGIYGGRGNWRNTF